MLRTRAALVLAALVAAGIPRRAHAADDAAAAAKRGDLAQALTLSEAAVTARPQSASAWSVRGYVLSTAGKKEEALVAYAKAASIDPRDVFSRVNRASVLLALGRAEDAVPPLDEALRIDPSHARAHNHRGVALERLGRLDEARTEYRTAIRLSPRDAIVYNNLGSLAFRRGVGAPASSHFARALEIDPTFQAASANATLAMTGSRSPEVSAKAEAELLAAAKRPDASYRLKARAQSVLGARAARARDWAQAKARFLEAVTLDPEDPAALNDLAVAEDQLGEARDALNHLEAAIERRGDDATLRNNMGVVHVHRGDLAAAERVFREVLKDDPRFHRAWHNLGVVLGAKGDRSGAVLAFRRASDLAPADASTVYNLAILSRDTGGDRGGERAAYERAIAIDPALAEAHLSLGTLLADPATPGPLRDETKARVHLRRFLVLGFEDDVAGRKQANDWLGWLDAVAASRGAGS